MCRYYSKKKTNNEFHLNKTTLFAHSDPSTSFKLKCSYKKSKLKFAKIEDKSCRYQFKKQVHQVSTEYNNFSSF